MQTLILHVGYPKTGTSAIQWFLNAHRESLRQAGVYYPLTGQALTVTAQDTDHAHHKLAFSLAENEYEQWTASDRARLFEELALEIDTCGAEVIVLSSELFLYRLEGIQASPEFGRILRGHSLRVVCFLRRQATFMESLYRHFIWDAAVRFTAGPDTFLATYPFAGDYHTTLKAWAGFAGKENIVPVVYEQAQHAGGCIRCFCRLLGVDPSRLPAGDLDVRRNVTVAPNVATEMIRLANTCSSMSRDQLLELADAVRNFAGAIDHFPLPRQLFAPELVVKIESMFRESNEKLAEDFVRQPLDGGWFREQPVGAAISS